MAGDVGGALRRDGFYQRQDDTTMLEQIQNVLLQYVGLINVYLSDYILVFLLVGIGLWTTVKTRFVQVRCFGESFRKVFGDFSLSGKKHESGMSSFQALATAVAAQVGTGCIVGAAGAILTGGPGSIFWMWVISFFGMATNYAEATLAQKTRIVDEDGTVKGGPVYYIRYRFKGAFGKFLACFFAIVAFLELGLLGSMVQSNSIAECFRTAFGVPTWIVGIVLVVLCGFVFLGGVKRLAAVVEKIVPVMATIFLLGALVVLIVNFRHIPATFAMIFKYAFVPQAIIGGGFGSALKIAVSQGAKRGLFSNEAGLGSTPHAHAHANVEKPHDQGCVAMFGVFVDSFVILTICALVIISATYVPGGILENGYVGEVTQTVSKTNLAQFAFSSVMGKTIGTKFVAVCLLFFAFSTMLSWNLFGKINSIYLFGKKFTPIYSTIALVFVFVGCVTSNDLVWEIADMLNNLMALPNAIALFALTSVVVQCAGVKKK
ncbi:MAG: sodium:alanine symporter family protein [Thermoguttaceae bacterium]|nr:sodium:alanine symporter family protein [Thermoguttaceae bacterium]MBR5758065.1 sodium:alanine symporter family protein [Thermoguttaceae bacterium]